MDTLTNNLKQSYFPYGKGIMEFDGLIILDTIKRPKEKELPQEAKDIIYRASKPIRYDMMCFLYCYSGQIIYQINMIEHHLKQHDMLFIQENAIVEIIVNDLNVQLIGIVFDKNHFPSKVGMKDYLVLHEMMAKYPMVHLGKAQTATILSACRHLEEVAKDQQNKFSSDLVKAYMKVLYLHCATAMNELDQSESITHEPRRLLILRRFFDLVEQYFIKERQIQFYADKLCLSPKYMSQVISQSSGKLAGEWIRERVILEAKLLLLDGHHNAQQVADALNFSSQSFFGKYFKAATGMSPKAYITKNRLGKE